MLVQEEAADERDGLRTEIAGLKADQAAASGARSLGIPNAKTTDETVLAAIVPST